MPIPTAYEHHAALKACATIRARLAQMTDDPGCLAMHKANRTLWQLNNLAGAHACRTNLPASQYSEALHAIDDAKAFGQPAIPAPEFEMVDEMASHGRYRCTLKSGRAYAVWPGADGGFYRGQNFGATIEDAMRGAEA